MKMSELFVDLSEFDTETLSDSRFIEKRFKRRKDPEEIKGISVTIDFLLRLTSEQMKAIELAVNNHDALVSALENTLDVFELFDDFGSCNSCGKSSHDEDCDYKKAKQLLNKIKGDNNG